MEINLKKHLLQVFNSFDEGIFNIDEPNNLNNMVMLFTGSLNANGIMEEEKPSSDILYHKNMLKSVSLMIRGT